MESWKKMKFTAIVGNPPYQITVSDGGNNQHDLPIYNYFYDSAFSIADVVSFISPARFLTGAGYTPKEWNQKILEDKHIKVVYYNSISSKVFPNTDIKGGVVILLRDSKRELGPIGFFTTEPILTEIAKKIKSYIGHERSIKDIIFLQTKMNLDKVYKDFPKFKSSRPSNSVNDIRLGTDIFTALPQIFTNTKSNSSIKILGLIKNKREYNYIKSEYLINDSSSTDIKKYKVILPAANGSGVLGEIISTPLIGKPGMGHTMSFRSIGKFDTEVEAENVLKYIKSKFARVMIGVKKTTQHMNPGVFEYLPNQDFTNKSDIDWSKPISEIDKQLYKKYGLEKKEIDFIETHVKAMS